MQKIISILLVISIFGFIASGCAGIRDAKIYEMKKSPCVCFDDVNHRG